MNTTHTPIPTSITSLDVPPALRQLSYEFVRAVIFFFIPLELLYFSFYFCLKRCYRTYYCLSCLSLIAIWIFPLVTPVLCGPNRSAQNLAGNYEPLSKKIYSDHEVVFVTTMKVLDIWARRHALPIYKAGKTPPDWYLALLLLIELRYESFNPNNVRITKGLENISEPWELGLHLSAFIALSSLSLNHPTVQAFELLLSIYILFTSIHLAFRYKNSPALFGPLYMADSLAGFWAETWHNIFTAPCMSLAYHPLRNGVRKLGYSDQASRAIGVLGVFSMMAGFHMYTLNPLLKRKAINRVGLYFFLNGVATVIENAIWGKKKHWMKSVLAWGFEISISSWIVSSMDIHGSLLRIPWHRVCESKI